MSLLTIVILFPLIGAIATALTPRTETALIRAAAAFSTFVSMVLSVVVFVLFEPGTGSYQFVQKSGWVESLGISFHVGVDGINVGLVLMSAIVAFSASLLSKDINPRERVLYAPVDHGVRGPGAFASLDLFFFYFFMNRQFQHLL